MGETTSLRANVILACDVFLPFAPELMGPLCDTIREILVPEGVAFVAYERRFDASSVFRLCASRGLSCEVVPDAHLHHVYQDPGKLFVLEMRRTVLTET